MSNSFTVMHADIVFYTQHFLKSKMQMLTLCPSCVWSGVYHLHCSPIWCCALFLWLSSVDNTNVCHFPTLHPTFCIVSGLGMGKKVGTHTAGTADSCWMKDYATPCVYIPATRMDRGIRTEEFWLPRWPFFRDWQGISLQEVVTAYLCITCFFFSFLHLLICFCLN